jgi:hypothetical protein
MLIFEGGCKWFHWIEIKTTMFQDQRLFRTENYQIIFFPHLRNTSLIRNKFLEEILRRKRVVVVFGKCFENWEVTEKHSCF